MREALKEGFARQVQGVRDALEADRTVRRTEAESVQSVMNDIRQCIYDEGRARQSLEERHHQDLSTLQDRIDTHSRYQAETKQDIEKYMMQLTSSANKELEEHNRTVLHLRAAVEGAQLEAQTRFQKLEDRSNSLETRHSDHSSRLATQLNQLWTKTHGLSNTVEGVRLKARAGEALDNGSQMEDRDQQQDDGNDRVYSTASQASHTVSQPRSLHQVTAAQTAPIAGYPFAHPVVMHQQPTPIGRMPQQGGPLAIQQGVHRLLTPRQY
jgi:hypothetical protein